MMDMPRPKESSRREFLKGKSAAQALADVAQRASQADAPAELPAALSSRATFLTQVTRRAMACDFSVFLNASQHQAAEESALAALDLIDGLEDQLTVFRDDSEVSRLNVAAADRPVVVERGLFCLLQLAVELYEKTGGAFDVTAGPLSKLWGFHRREERLPIEQSVGEVLQRVGSRWLKLDASAHSVSFLRPGLQINFGAIGKGYALDRCAEVLQQAGVDDFLIHGGQSSVLARGRRAGEPSGWRVAVRHPLRPETRLGELTLSGAALATSGSSRQHFIHHGRRYGHILDPRTGQPAQGVVSATVVASTAAVADALATAFFVMGPQQTREFCEREPGVAAVLVVPGDREGSVRVELCGPAADVWHDEGGPA